MRDVREAARRRPPVTAQERRRIVAEIATVMQEAPVIRDPGSRQTFLHELGYSLNGTLSYREVGLLRPQLVELVTG